MNTISTLPPAPSRSDPATFSSRADALLGSLDDFVSQANALALDVEASAASAAASAAAVGAEKWVSGHAYAEGEVVWSPADYLGYRAKQATSGTTDPSEDATNWAPVVFVGDVTLAGSQTLVNKTIDEAENTLVGVATLTGEQTLTNKTLTAPSIVAARYASIAGAGTTLDLAAADHFQKVITENTQFSVFNIPPPGKLCAFVLELVNGGAYTTLLWANIGWPNGITPSLSVSGKDILVFYTADGGATWNGFIAGQDIS